MADCVVELPQESAAVPPLQEEGPASTEQASLAEASISNAGVEAMTVVETAQEVPEESEQEASKENEAPASKNIEAADQPGTPKKKARSGKISKRELKAVASPKARWLPKTTDKRRGRSTARFEFEEKEAEPLWQVQLLNPSWYLMKSTFFSLWIIGRREKAGGQPAGCG